MKYRFISFEMSLPNPPTPNCNYLLDERIMFGWYPGPPEHGEMSNDVNAILETGRTVFVNLTSKHEIAILHNYIPCVQNSVFNPIFIHYPIPDQGLPSDLSSYKKFLELLCFLVNQNEKIYIHCRGGHGRSGIVAACLLIHLGYSNEDALEMVSTAHKTRAYIPDYPCPQTEDQCVFVRKYTM